MTRVILDTDLAMGAPGSDIDDGFALALAHAEPLIELDMITTVNGNTDVESATLLSLELAERLGCGEVPIYRGAGAPLTRPDRFCGAPADTVAAFGHHEPKPGYAAVEITRHILANPGDITLVPIGPLTNVAAALSLDHRLATSVREIVVMGGIFLGQTHATGMPGEFNIWKDPEAAEAVLHSGAPLRFVGLDVTLQVRLTRAHAGEMAAAGGAFGEFAGSYTTGWIDHQAARHPDDPLQADSCAMHDPLAVAVVAHPEFVTWRDARVDVVTGDGPARGVMVTDLLTSVDAPPPNCQIATAVDAEAFMSYFLDTIAQL
ncbi:MAG: Inosine-uridine preferring nucleoside hydrolase [uncultured Propionibacteriaceae bacterium]|uniref:Inosine-uridine preferring nucleoside hydrolase n=1 Tax=uncultured Propionibacteriaceae bacterium TaxID=257457 RepID=A0A6J4P710_9ACTN|nr:MAG: Inosine-uridine preferring nucleoside hydrolase [uncultured Propionibacteriaceae bacterium]